MSSLMRGIAGRILRGPGGLIARGIACCCGPVNCRSCPTGTPQQGDPLILPVIDTLYARIRANEGCECLDGLCVTLTWVSTGSAGEGIYQGTIATPTCTGLPGVNRFITLVMECCGDGLWALGTDDCSAGEHPATTNTACTPSGVITGSVKSELGGTCKPYNIVFKKLPALTCCGVMPASIDVTVSETAC